MVTHTPGQMLQGHPYIPLASASASGLCLLPCYVPCIAAVEDSDIGSRLLFWPTRELRPELFRPLRTLSVSNIKLVKKKKISKLIMLFLLLWLLGSSKPLHIPLMFGLIFLL